MRRCGFVLWSLLALTAAVTSSPAWGDDKAVDDEMNRLRGEWKRVSAVLRNGRKPPGAEAEVRLKLKDGRWDKTREGSTFGGTFKLDPATDPKAIDLTFSGAGEVPSLLGIYKIKGDELTIVIGSAKERPVGFDTEEGGSGTVEVYERVKK